MIIHICDCCKKEIPEEELTNYLIPAVQYTEARDSAGRLIARYKMDLCVARDIELCPVCANKLAVVFESMTTSAPLSSVSPEFKL